MEMVISGYTFRRLQKVSKNGASGRGRTDDLLITNRRLAFSTQPDNYEFNCIFTDRTQRPYPITSNHKFSHLTIKVVTKWLQILWN